MAGLFDGLGHGLGQIGQFLQPGGPQSGMGQMGGMAGGGLQKLMGMFGGGGAPGGDIVNGQSMSPADPMTTAGGRASGSWDATPPALGPSGTPPLPTPQPGDIQAAAPVQANVPGLTPTPTLQQPGGLFSGVTPEGLQGLGKSLMGGSQPSVPPPVQFAQMRRGPGAGSYLRR